jgi:hypothetical protein
MRFIPKRAEMVPPVANDTCNKINRYFRKAGNRDLIIQLWFQWVLNI